jgi:hypothetical protein
MLIYWQYIGVNSTERVTNHTSGRISQQPEGVLICYKQHRIYLSVGRSSQSKQREYCTTSVIASSLASDALAV